MSKKNGELIFTASPGGLATAMSSLDIDPANKVWIGWPGIVSDELTPADRTKITKELRKSGFYPVYLTSEQITKFYSGYSNDTIWPLFHYFQSYTQFNNEYWTAYQEVNEVFKSAVKKQSKAEDIIWIHDYHLMLLPSLVRKSLPRASIGFFLHIPFPSYEIFRQLPNRSALIEGLLGADLIGFHIYDYTRHFLSSVHRTTGIENSRGTVRIKGRTVKTDAFPIGIDYKKFSKAAKQVQKSEAYKAVVERYEGEKIILSVDRLDYSKGIIKRLEAFEKLLQENPSYQKKVSMIVIAVPSRTEVETYKELRDAIELAVSRINGTYSTVDWTPVSYQFQNLPFEELVALYARAEIALVTPLRDGMNLVAKEFVASKANNLGVLILSEMAGAIDELHEALKVNPNDVDSIVKTIKRALRMTKNEQRARILLMKNRISQYTVQRWATDFLENLESVKKHQLKSDRKVITPMHIGEILTAFTTAEKRLLFLDYDGSLRSFSRDFSTSRSAPPKKLMGILNNLSAQKNTHIYIISGRKHEALQKWFGHLNISLIAEHGAWQKHNGNWEQRYEASTDFKPKVLPILQKYTERTPGSKIEEKTSALVWHFRNVPTDLAYTRRSSLRRELNVLIDKEEIGVYSGNKIIEIKPKNINKGDFVEEIVNAEKADFILSIGDDYTDEDMFRVLPFSAYTIKVGYSETIARYQIDSVDQVIRMMELLSEI